MSGKPTTETFIRPQVPHQFVQKGGEGMAVQPTEEKKPKPKIRDSMGRTLDGNQASYRRGLLYPEKSQGETKICAPRATVLNHFKNKTVTSSGCRKGPEDN